jgi:phosphatidylserine/phosphatidylglycerophosphate/cardiolipin synthase-like enzyme
MLSYEDTSEISQEIEIYKILSYDTVGVSYQPRRVYPLFSSLLQIEPIRANLSHLAEVTMRRPFTPFSLLPVLVLLLIPSTSYPLNLTLSNTPTQLYFSPHGGCTEAIIREIDLAKTEILIQAFSFTSVPIAKALINDHKRGVKVQAILDKSQRSEKYTSASFLANVGIPTFIDAAHAIAHNKIMVIDRDRNFRVL